jgi:two-component system cell cycle sensor histidine kinase/response regulator CckA
MPGPRILVVDDEPQLLRILVFSLRRDGFDVLAAASGREAIDLYSKNHGQVDAVIMDVNLPDIDGRSTVEILRELNPDVLCCFITGNTSRSGEEKLLERGAFLLQKPFVASEVSQILRHLLGRKASIRSVSAS